MNERIRKLAEQFKMDFSVDGYHQEGIYWDNVDEFAELIIKECVDIISPYTVRMNKPGESYLHPIQEIKQHFGVEE